ncbi:MAG: hypothetical protein OQK35_02355 [Alphaproteobacteria bacterium]|nr:hypothetical protein [Rhodospirillales bacterium]MCW9045150.1 hypothetical protein [Alphaproteobacteria bacterium]
MKKLMIILIVLVMLGAGTVGVLQQLKIGPFADPEGTAEEEVVDDEPPVFIDMEALSIPVFQGDKVITTIQIMLKLEVVKEQQAEVNRILPRIHDTFLKDLYAFIPRALKKGDRLNLVLLKIHLMQVVKRMKNDDKITNVLIQSIVDNPKG